MYLFTQDKTKLLEFERIEVVKAFGTYCIRAYGKNEMSISIVGQYSSQEDANTEVRHIIDALNNGQKVYEVK